MTETDQNELLNLVSSAKLTLAETYDLQTRLPKDFKELYDFHKKEFPSYPLSPPPEQSDIVIFSFNDLPAHRLFLSMIEKALQLRFKKTVKITSGTGWDKAKFVIAPDYGIWSDPALAKNFREGENGGRSYLGQTPLFLLTDLSLYMKEPKLKRALWIALCQELQKIGSPRS